MALMVDPEPVPLATGADGVARVGATRVTLDTVVAAILEGATAEEIAQQYPTLRLADVYSVIGYYLREREGEAARLREEVEARFDPTGVRARLLFRREH